MSRSLPQSPSSPNAPIQSVKPQAPAAPGAVPAVSAAQDADAGGQTLALARVLGRVITALELLAQEIPRPPSEVGAETEIASDGLANVRSELALARSELAPLQGGGDALLSTSGRFAKAQQRADPEQSPHFGG